jgi:hypothetical protein
MSLQSNITSLATRIATEFKTVKTLISGNNQGDLSGLDTTNKANIVAAINEVNAIAEGAAGGGATIDDVTVSTGSVYSSSRTEARIAEEVAELVASAPGTLDTLDELAAALGDDANYAATTTTALGNRVRVDTAAQGLTTTQQSNARTNIAAASTTEVSTLRTDMGDHNADFVATFVAGLSA